MSCTTLFTQAINGKGKNMLRPALRETLEDDQNVFSLVVAVSKRAREITDSVEDKKKELIERNGGKLPSDLGEYKTYLESKPVKLSVEEFAKGDIHYEVDHSEEEK